MASSSSFYKAVLMGINVLVISAILQSCMGARQLTALVEETPVPMEYHKGALLTGPISVNLIWYGKFTSSQRAIVSDFVTSLSSSAGGSKKPSVAGWWGTVQQYYTKAGVNQLPVLTLGEQILDEGCSRGKSLEDSDLAALAARGPHRRAINVVLTASDVAVKGFCMSRCGTHKASPRSKSGRFAYIWVGDSTTQCPGQCAWPFHQPEYGPQDPPLTAPNGDVGADGMVINVAAMIAAVATNPFSDGFYQGSKGAPLEAGSACAGVYAKGAYPGYPGDLLKDPTTGASYNANGAHGRKYLLPAWVDPSTAHCSTLV